MNYLGKTDFLSHHLAWLSFVAPIYKTLLFFWFSSGIMTSPCGSYGVFKPKKKHFSNNWDACDITITTPFPEPFFQFIFRVITSRPLVIESRLVYASISLDWKLNGSILSSQHHASLKVFRDMASVPFMRALKAHLAAITWCMFGR